MSIVVRMRRAYHIYGYEEMEKIEGWAAPLLGGWVFQILPGVLRVAARQISKVRRPLVRTE